MRRATRRPDDDRMKVTFMEINIYKGVLSYDTETRYKAGGRGGIFVCEIMGWIDIHINLWLVLVVCLLY